MKNTRNFDNLLQAIRDEYQQAKRQASLADTASNLTPAKDIGTLIRQQRKQQGLTLVGLCELSEVSYTTLVKLEKGNPSARLDILNRVLNALGLKLWVG
jgi:DNA-binding XRE family transcriptional regulator